MTESLQKSLVLVDYFDRRWADVYAHVINNLQEAGYGVTLISSAYLQYPSRHSRLLDIKSKFRPVSPKLQKFTPSLKAERVCEDSHCPGVSKELWESELVSMFRDEKPSGWLAERIFIRKRLRGHAFFHFLERSFDPKQITTIYVPNGRLGLQQVLLTWAAIHGLKVIFLETWYTRTEPKEIRLFKQPFSPHDGFRIQQEILDRSEEPQLEAADNWVMDRASPRGLERTKFKKTWKAGILPEELTVTLDGSNVFFTSSVDEYTALSKRWKRENWSSQYEAFASVLEILERRPSQTNILRVHPNLATRSSRQIEKEIYQIRRLKLAYPDLIVVGPRSSLDSYFLVAQAKRVIVSMSTIGLEASLLGKPVWCTANNAYDRLADVRPIFNNQILSEAQLSPFNVDPANAARFFLQFRLLTEPMTESGGPKKVRHSVWDTLSFLSERHLPAKTLLLVYNLFSLWKRKGTLRMFEWDL